MSVVPTFSPCTNVSSPVSIHIYFVCSIIFCPMLVRLNPRSSLSRVSLLHLLRYLACFISSILCRPGSSSLSRSWNSGRVGPSWLTLVIVLSTPIDHFGAKPYLWCETPPWGSLVRWRTGWFDKECGDLERNDLFEKRVPRLDEELANIGEDAELCFSWGRGRVICAAVRPRAPREAEKGKCGDERIVSGSSPTFLSQRLEELWALYYGVSACVHKWIRKKRILAARN